VAERVKNDVDRRLADLGHLPHIRWPEHVYLVENLVDILAQLRDRRAATPLLEQLAKLNAAIRRHQLNAAIRRHHNPQLVHCCEAAKVKIHRALIEFGEKRGLEDLTEMLGDGRKRVRDGVVDAIGRIGDRRALVPLVRLVHIDEHARSIKQAIREIVRRERVTPEDRLFKDLNPSERAALVRVFPKPRRRKS
jgi:HEAT repeat protein